VTGDFAPAPVLARSFSGFAFEDGAEVALFVKGQHLETVGIFSID
tara:strand:- start:945 stop:1079 length:135 start_codon:yes stop_codon:yes gene_type:complete